MIDFKIKSNAKDLESVTLCVSGSLVTICSDCSALLYLVYTQLRGGNPELADEFVKMITAVVSSGRVWKDSGIINEN